jgi:RimJ/RimL family protein N-acetyltransferase
MTVNFGSRRVLEKSGFHLVDTVFPDFPDPVPGQEQGEMIYEIRRGILVTTGL